MTDAIAQRFEQLATQYESDIINDAHNIWLKINRSSAREELVSLGKGILELALKRAKEHQQPDLILAWCAILQWILEQHYDMSLAPQDGIYRNNTAAWIEFAQYCLNGHIRQVRPVA